MATKSLNVDDVRIVRRQLRFKNNSADETKTVRLAFGVGVDTQNYRIQQHNSTKGALEIRAYPKSQSQSENYIVLAPNYHATDVAKVRKTGEKLRLKLWVVQTDLDRLATRQVVQRVHYLSDSGRGMILACAFQDTDQQHAFRKSARHSSNSAGSEAISWLLPAGGIIACAVLDTLWHGNPVAGRSLIAAELKWNNRWTKWSRSEIVKKMRVAWGSRFAVDEPYQSLGIGTLLAKHLKQIARWYRAPSANFLEVITTQPRDAETAEKHDFLVRAGYVRMPDKMKSGSMMVMDPSTGYREPKPAVKNYYFADLRNEH